MARRTLIKAMAAVAGAVAIAPTGVLAAPQDQAAPPVPGGPGPATPPTTTTNPPRDFTAPSVYFNDPDVLTVDPAFNDLVQGNTTIARLWHGDVNGKPILWAEGPAWNSQGRYLLWSDIPNNRQLRWLDDDGHVSVFREPSNNSNGNTFDFEGRQISCEHLMRRVVRYELDGSVTVLADSYQGKRLNSPNDAVPHPDGSIWFTDPPYGGQFYEGDVDQPVRAVEVDPALLVLLLFESTHVAVHHSTLAVDHQSQQQHDVSALAEPLDARGSAHVRCLADPGRGASIDRGRLVWVRN